MEVQTVRLTKDEEELARQVGIIRNRNAIADNKKPSPFCSRENDEVINIFGACCELAGCKWLGVKWPATIDTYKSAADVYNLEIRGRSKLWHDLIIRKNDNPAAPFILVLVLNGAYWCQGWILGKGGQKDEWYKTFDEKPKAFFVPQRFLKPMSDLPINWYLP